MMMDSSFAGDGERLQASDPRTACRSKTRWVCHLRPEGDQGKTPGVSVLCQSRFARQ